MITLEDAGVAKMEEQGSTQDEQWARDLVRNLSPEQRRALEWFMTLPPARYEYVLRRLNQETGGLDARMTEGEIREVGEEHAESMRLRTEAAERGISVTRLIGEQVAAEAEQRDD